MRPERTLTFKPAARLLVTLAGLVLGTSPVQAEPPAPPPSAATPATAGSAPAPALSDDDPLPYDLRIELPVTIAGGVAWIGSELLKSQLAPSACRWCDRNADGRDTLNALDGAARRALKLSDPAAADLASSLLGFALVPAAMIGATALAALPRPRLKVVLLDALVLVEAAVAAADLNQLVKLVAGRERPWRHALAPGATVADADADLSFYSGHTTLAFALAVAAGTVATLHRSRLAPWIYAAGLTLATTVGALRIAADKHYLSDVLVGAAVGGATGFAVPYLAHRRRAAGPVRLSLGMAPLPGGGMALALAGRW